MAKASLKWNYQTLGDFPAFHENTIIILRQATRLGSRDSAQNTTEISHAIHANHDKSLSL